MAVNSGELPLETLATTRSRSSLCRPKGVGFGQGAGALGMDTGEHLGNKSGSEMR